MLFEIVLTGKRGRNVSKKALLIRIFCKYCFILGFSFFVITNFKHLLEIKYQVTGYVKLI